MNCLDGASRNRRKADGELFMASFCWDFPLFSAVFRVSGQFLGSLWIFYLDRVCHRKILFAPLPPEMIQKKLKQWLTMCQVTFLMDIYGSSVKE